MESKDIYFENLAQHADDKDIINMLSVNKRFNDPVFFQIVLQRRYPLLLQFKKRSETWRKFYVSMIHSIAFIQEKFGVPYIPSEKYNPREELKTIKKDSNPYRLFLVHAIQSGNLDVVEQITPRVPRMSLGAIIIEFNENDKKRNSIKKDIRDYLENYYWR